MHLKSMTEICNKLSAIGEPVNEEDRVVYLLASLPESYNVLVTALEANTAVPALAVVTERRRSRDEESSKSTLATRVKKKPICYFCQKVGHIKRKCEDFARARGPKPSQEENENGGF